MKQDLFKNPKSVFEEQLNELFSTRKGDDKSLLLQALSIILFQDPKNKDLSLMYDQLGLEGFSRLVNTFNGRTITFFTRAEFDEAMIVAICYYLKEIEGLEWKEIQEIVPFEVSSISIGVKIKSLNKSMQSILNEIFQEILETPPKEQANGPSQNEPGNPGSEEQNE